MKLVFSRKICEKYSNTKFHENRSSGSQVVQCGRTDIHDKANSRFFATLLTRLNLASRCLISRNFHVV